MVAALLREADRLATLARPVPVGKELRATLEGKEVAIWVSPARSPATVAVDGGPDHRVCH